MMNAYAIIPAAGSGRRFGGRKQFQLLAQKPLFLYAAQTFLSSPSIQGICLTVPEDDIPFVRSALKGLSDKEILVVAGGRERQDSVKNGFEAIPQCELIAVHDGVRPFVTPEMIERCLDAARSFGGCVVGLPVKETTKRVDGSGFIEETVDRSPLWSIQTPQVFRYEIFREAIDKATAEGFLGTDEAMLVERLGERVKVIEGSPYNIKITTPEDMKIAEMILSSGGDR